MKLFNTTAAPSTLSVDDEYDPEWVGIFEAVLLFFILLLAIVGNFLVIAVVYRRRELRRSETHIFIVNLSVTDISVALLCMPFSLVTAVTQKWIFSEAMCQLNGFLNVFFLLTSILTLTAISIHKYIGIVQPLKKKIFTRKRAIFAVVWVWLQAFLTALTPILGWNQYEYIAGRTQCSVQVPRKPDELANCLFIIICGFVIPLGIMSFSYMKIFQTVKVHTKRVRSHSFGDEPKTAFLNERRITVTLFIILAVFLACWTPFSILTIYATLVGRELPKYFSVAAYWLGFLNSAMNPLIYALRTREFRQGYRRIIALLMPCLFPNGDTGESDSLAVLRGRKSLKSEAFTNRRFRKEKDSHASEDEPVVVVNGGVQDSLHEDSGSLQYETSSERSSKEKEKNESFYSVKATALSLENIFTIEDPGKATEEKEVRDENENTVVEHSSNGIESFQYHLTPVPPICEYLPCSSKELLSKHFFPNNSGDLSQTRRKSASYLSVLEVNDGLKGRLYRSKSVSSTYSQSFDKERGHSRSLVDFHQQNGNPWLPENLSYLNKIAPIEISGKREAWRS